MYNSVGIYSVPAGIAAVPAAGMAGMLWLGLAIFALIAVGVAIMRMTVRKSQPQP